MKLHDMLFKHLIDWANATGQQPTLVELPTRAFIALADELSIVVPKAPERVLYRQPSWAMKLTESPDPSLESFQVGTVRVVHEFVMQGPITTIRIRENIE